MKTFNILVTSSKTAIFAASHPQRGKKGEEMCKKRDEEKRGRCHDELTNKREIRDKYMIYIYIFYQINLAFNSSYFVMAIDELN
jgi:hypothetical protein